MRKASSVAVLAAIALTVGACGGGEEGGGSGGTKKVVYVQGLSGNPFYTTVGCGAQSVAKELGVDFSVQGAPEFDVAKQTSIVNALMTNKPDAIMISVTDPKAMIAPLKIAASQDVPIVTIDGDLADKDVVSSNIESNNKEGGRLAGEQMAKLTGEKGAVLAISQTPGVPTGDDRVNGFKEAIAKYPDMRYLGVKYSENDITKAASAVTATAAGNKDLAGVFAASTNNTEGALTGIREAKLEGKVKSVGYDTSDPIVKALEDGKLDADIVQYPFGEGETGLRTAVKAADGEDVPRDQSSPFVVATPDNVQSEKVQKYIYSTECK